MRGSCYLRWVGKQPGQFGAYGRAALPVGGRVPELDGLRALAILPVIISHCCPLGGWWDWGQAGWVGVDLFFVLSGYLISGILLDTVGKRHYYWNFIVRRTLRIFPLYYVCLLLFTAATLISGSQWQAMQAWGGVGWFFAYLGNVRIAWISAMPPVFSFDPLWSLQVEEQFYLLYPIVVLFFSGLGLRRFLIACAVVAPLLRLSLLFFDKGTGMTRYVLMPCRMDSLALGGLVALLMRSPRSRTLTFPRVRNGALLSGTIALVAVGISPSAYSALMSSVGYTIIDITCALLLIMVLRWPARGAVKWLRWPPLVYTGRIAYGLYLLHAPASWAARCGIQWLTGVVINGHSGLSIPVTLISSYAVAALSWRWFETPVLAYKDRYTRSDRRTLHAAAAAAGL